MPFTTGRNYLPDSGFTNGWRFPDDGGSNAWGVPPVIGFDPEEFMGEGATGTRADNFHDWLGDIWDFLEVEPLYESWQKTPGNALHIATSDAGGNYLNSGWVPIVPTRRYVLSYGKKIVDAYLPYARLYIQVFFYNQARTVQTGQLNVGEFDNAIGVYQYDHIFTPPSIASGASQDSYWARVRIKTMGAGGGSFGANVNGYLDDIQLSAAVEPPSETTTPGKVDPGSVESEVGVWMYDALQPLQTHEERLGFPLLAFCDGIGSMFQPIYDIVADANIMLDPDRTPVGWIPWLAQFVGQPLPGDQLPDEQDAAYRARMTPYIKDPPHRRRGTVPAILEEVKKFLVPGANVYAVERQGGNMYIGSIGVISSQMLAGATLAQIQARVEQIAPAGRIITVTEITGGDWLSLRTTHTDWADVLSTYDDWAEVKANPTL